MAAGKGMGIADMLYKQMRGAHHAAAAIPDSVGVTPMALDGETINSMPVHALEQVIRRAMPHLPGPVRHYLCPTATVSLSLS